MPDDKPRDPAPGSGSTRTTGGDLPPKRERIQAAKDAATRRRIEQGLPPEADDGPFTDEALAARRKRKR